MATDHQGIDSTRTYKKRGKSILMYNLIAAIERLLAFIHFDKLSNVTEYQ